jgi:hypothetical protein
MKQNKIKEKQAKEKNAKRHVTRKGKQICFSMFLA